MGKTTYVIKDENGNFVSSGMNLFRVGNEYHYLCYTGIGTSTGYIFLTNKKRTEELLAKLHRINNRYRFGKEFRIEKIDNIESIPEGETLVIKLKLTSYVIKDQDGNFINDNFAFSIDDDGCLYHYLTGVTTGFCSWLNNIDAAKTALKKLQMINDKYGFGKVFNIEEIDDIKSIPTGKSVYMEVTVA